MKVLVLGAGGKTGQLVVDRALKAGHQVTALVRPHDGEEKHPFAPSVEIIHGDAQNPSRLATAMEGCKAIIDTIGGKTPFLHTDLETATAKVVISAMHTQGVKRLIAISALGAGDSGDQSGFFYKHLMLPTFLRGSTQDKTNMETEIEKSNLDWVIVRPPILSDADPKGSVKVFEHGQEAHSVTRADLAQFLVDQLTDSTHLGQAIVIANT